MLGYTPPEDAAGGYGLWRKLVHPDDLPQAEANFLGFLQDPQQSRFTARFRMRTADGSWRWILSFAQALTRDATGAPTRVVGVHLDIHDQEETRQQLMRSKRRLQAVLEHVPLAFGLFRRTEAGDFIIEDSNPAATEILGVDTRAMIGSSLLDAFPRLGSTRLPQLLHLVIDQKSPHIEEDFPYLNRLNQEHFYTIIAFPVGADLAGVFFRDITTSRLARQETEDALRLFTAVFHLSPEALALVDARKNILHANSTFVQLAASAEALPQTLDEIAILPTALCTALCTAVFEQGETIRQEAQGMRADATPMPLAITARPLVLHGETHMLLALRDMTEHHRIQELLVQTEKMLSLGGIAAGIAHEINNPLGIILQNAQNAELRLRPDFPKNRQVAEELGVTLEDVHRYVTARGIPNFLADIRDAGGRAAGIVRTMLDFGRKSESRRTICAVHDMLETAISLASKDYDLKKHYDFRRITIERDYAPALPPVFVAQTEIEQIFLNLLRNAAHALHEAPPAEGPRIRITTRHHQGMVRIRIADNGPGIPAEVLPHIFEPFFTTKPPGHGTGLGLAVSYFIAQNHSGRLWAESEPGHGAAFFLELPTPEPTPSKEVACASSS
jgi:PAS domain S-box-containing protein